MSNSKGVTALTYRPKNFDELVGQDFIATTLKEELGHKKTAHAYLFSGPRGVGKTTTARLLAQALNHGDDTSDEQWLAIRNGTALDVIEIDGASHTSVQDVRQIKEEALYPPQRSPYKIYIIDEVHMLSGSAFNALLKTIEEPPSYVVFIFATTEPERLPLTVRSRCQQFHFRRLPVSLIVHKLAHVAQELSVPTSTAVLEWIAKEAEGSMRDAYTLFDQISVIHDGLTDLDRLRRSFGLVEIDTLGTLITHLESEEIRDALEIIDRLLSSGVGIETLCNDLCSVYRGAFLHGYDLTLDGGSHPLSESAQQALARYSQSECMAIVEELLALYRRLRFALNQQYELELAIARIGYIKRRMTVSDVARAMRENTASSGGSTEQASVGRSSTDRPPADRPPADRPPADRSTRATASPSSPSPLPSTDTSPQSASAQVLSPDDVGALIASLKSSHRTLYDILTGEAQWVRDNEQITITIHKAFNYDKIYSEKDTVRNAIAHQPGQEITLRIVSECHTTESAARNQELANMVKKTFDGTRIGHL